MNRSESISKLAVALVKFNAEVSSIKKDANNPEEVVEVWRDVKGYEGIYEVSNLGRVKSFRFKNSNKETILKNLFDKDGYCKVNLYKNKKIKRVSVHKLVAVEFVPNNENKEQINHIDGNKENNAFYNLEWVTSKENIMHSIETGLSKRKGADNYKSQKVICTTTGIEYVCLSDAEKQTGANRQNITKVCRGLRSYAGKTDSGDKLIWKYKE